VLKGHYVNNSLHYAIPLSLHKDAPMVVQA